jgi:trimeric autotransporter adhesin
MHANGVLRAGKLCTVFSAPDYPQHQAVDDPSERYNNKASVVLLGPADYTRYKLTMYSAVPRPPAQCFYELDTPGSDDEAPEGVYAEGAGASEAGSVADADDDGAVDAPEAAGGGAFAVDGADTAANTAASDAAAMAALDGCEQPRAAQPFAAAAAREGDPGSPRLRRPAAGARAASRTPRHPRHKDRAPRIALSPEAGSMVAPSAALQEVPAAVAASPAAKDPARSSSPTQVDDEREQNGSAVVLIGAAAEAVPPEASGWPSSPAQHAAQSVLPAANGSMSSRAGAQPGDARASVTTGDQVTAATHRAAAVRAAVRDIASSDVAPMAVGAQMPGLRTAAHGASDHGADSSAADADSALTPTAPARMSISDGSGCEMSAAVLACKPAHKVAAAQPTPRPTTAPATLRRRAALSDASEPRQPNGAAARARTLTATRPQSAPVVWPRPRSRMEGMLHAAGQLAGDSASVLAPRLKPHVQPAAKRGRSEQRAGPDSAAIAASGTDDNAASPEKAGEAVTLASTAASNGAVLAPLAAQQVVQSVPPGASAAAQAPAAGAAVQVNAGPCTGRASARAKRVPAHLQDCAE